MKVLGGALRRVNHFKKKKEDGKWMKDGTHAEIQEIDKERLIDILTEELPVLRAKIGLS